MKIVIIGAGWYGCYCAYLLQNKYDLILIDKNNEIFDNSSYYNQNRLHLGYHYPRNFDTRNLCKKYFNTFKEKFPVTDKIENNFYLISNKSLIDNQTFLSIYKYENYNVDVVKNEYFSNVDGDIFIVDEEVINSNKSKKFFIDNLKCKMLLNTKVENVNIEETPHIITQNNKITCDLIIDCTYNFLNLSKKEYTYEKTISLLYVKNSDCDCDFKGMTIMDGDFCSLYPHDINKNIFTLTDVEYTPLIKSNNIENINNFKLTDDILNNTISNMEKKITHYFNDFKKIFKYEGYFLSNKTKLISGSDTRECNIENFDNKLITVNCGKIIGIFEFEEYLKSMMLL